MSFVPERSGSAGESVVWVAAPKVSVRKRVCASNCDFELHVENRAVYSASRKPDSVFVVADGAIVRLKGDETCLRGRNRADIECFSVVVLSESRYPYLKTCLYSVGFDCLYLSSRRYSRLPALPSTRR